MIDPALFQVYDILQPLALWPDAVQAVFDPAQPDTITLQVHVPTALLNLGVLVESHHLRLRDRGEVVPPAPAPRHLQLEA